jgi:hypothetical protein
MDGLQLGLLALMRRPVGFALSLAALTESLESINSLSPELLFSFLLLLLLLLL